MAFPRGLESGYSARLMRRLKALRSLVLDRMGPSPTVPEALDAVRRTQSVAAGQMAPEPRSFMSDARALEVAVTRDVARSLKAPADSVAWQKPQVDALLSQWAATQAKLVAKLEADILADIGERVGEADEGEDLRALVTARFAAHEARAKFIARNELGRLQAQLVQLRAKGMGSNRYRWISQEDARVRPEHAARHGKVYSWDAPPPDGHPGEPAACRCIAEPLRDEVPKGKAKVTVTATPPATLVLPPRPPAAKPKPKPVTVPTLPPLSVPPPVALPPLPAFSPSALPAFPTGQVSPITAPVLAPKAPVPVLPVLQIPTFPKAPPVALPKDFGADKVAAKRYGDELASGRPVMTSQERVAVEMYSGGTFIDINFALRRGTTHRLVPALDAAIASNVLREPLVVYRGIAMHPDLADLDLIRPGDVIREPGYSSTSLSSGAAFGRNIMLRIEMPAGSRGLWLDDISDHPGELEVLLARGSRMQITRVEKVGSRTVIHCRLLES